MNRSAIAPKLYSGRDAAKLREYKRLCAIGDRIATYMNKLRSQMQEQKRLLPFYELASDLEIPEDDVRSLLWNSNGGGDNGITIYASDVLTK